MLISEEVLSYYSIEEDAVTPKIEYLKDHIKKALEYASDINESRLARFSKKILKIEGFDEMLRYAIVFHDIGKVFFQTREYLKKDKDCRKTYLSFRGHEFVSALLVDSFFKEKSKLDPGINYIPVLFAVLYHHHALNPHSRRNNIPEIISSEVYRKGIYKNHILNVLKPFLIAEDFEIVEMCLNDFVDSLTSFRPSIGRIEREIGRKLLFSKHGYVVRKTSMLLLSCLIACDYMAASERDEGTSPFFHTVSEFYNIWLKRLDI